MPETGPDRSSRRVIAILAAAHGAQSPPAHSSGKKLADVADIVVRYGTPYVIAARRIA